MKSNENSKFCKGTDIGANTASAIFASAPLVVILIGSIIGYLIGGVVSITIYTTKKLINKWRN